MTEHTTTIRPATEATAMAPPAWLLLASMVRVRRRDDRPRRHRPVAMATIDTPRVNDIAFVGDQIAEQDQRHAGGEADDVKRRRAKRSRILRPILWRAHFIGGFLAGRGTPGRFGFPADIEGVFEVELEHSGAPILGLTVNPR